MIWLDGEEAGRIDRGSEQSHDYGHALHVCEVPHALGALSLSPHPHSRSVLHWNGVSENTQWHKYPAWESPWQCTLQQSQWKENLPMDAPSSKVRSDSQKHRVTRGWTQLPESHLQQKPLSRKAGITFPIKEIHTPIALAIKIDTKATILYLRAFALSQSSFSSLQPKIL